MLINQNVILFILLSALPVIWFTTTPKSVWKIILTQFSPRQIMLILFESIPFLQLLHVITWSWPKNNFSSMTISIGWILFLIGWLLSLWAKITMKTSWGKPGQHNVDIQKRLVITGPFRFSRNPIYVGLLTLFVGFELILQSYIVLFSIPLFYLISKAVKKEELLLEKFFGKEYISYKFRVRKFL